MSDHRSMSPESMRSDNRQQELGCLFRAFARPNSFYVIGAGASAGIVPMTAELRQSIVKRYLSYGSFPVTPSKSDDIFHRVLGNPHEIEEPVMSALLERLYPSAVHAMVAKELTPSESTENAHSYEIFLLIKKPSTVFSLNVDGLAANYCVGHYLLEAHGRVPKRLVLSPWWEGLIDALLEFGFEAPEIPGLLLPQPEPAHITSHLAYHHAISLFRSAGFVIFIGYSFGLFRDSFDDIETFEFFRQLLKRSSKPVIVLSPEPGFIGSAIEEAVGQIKVHLLPLYWNHLCQAIKEEVCTHQCRDFIKLSGLIKDILYRHDELRECTS